METKLRVFPDLITPTSRKGIVMDRGGRIDRKDNPEEGFTPGSCCWADAVPATTTGRNDHLTLKHQAHYLAPRGAGLKDTVAH